MPNRPNSGGSGSPLDPAQRAALALRWKELEAERQGLSGLPSGSVDPTERERQIDSEMDEIEFDLGAA